jgi:hypothetical protein
MTSKWPRYAEGTENTECAMTSVDGDCTRYTIGTLYRARPIQHAKADEMDHDGSNIMPVMERGMRSDEWQHGRSGHWRKRWRVLSLQNGFTSLHVSHSQRPFNPALRLVSISHQAHYPSRSSRSSSRNELRQAPHSTENCHRQACQHVSQPHPHADQPPPTPRRRRHDPFRHAVRVSIQGAWNSS